MFRSVGRAGPVFVTAVRAVWFRGRWSTDRSHSIIPPKATFLFAAHNRFATWSSICDEQEASWLGCVCHAGGRTAVVTGGRGRVGAVPNAWASSRRTACKRSDLARWAVLPMRILAGNTASLSYRNDQLEFDPCFRVLLWRAINYSYRKATMGATLVARRAGTKVAMSATAASTSATPMKVTGSPAWTP